MLLKDTIGKKIAINCRTREEASKLIEMYIKLNVEYWRNYGFTLWDTYQENTCINPDSYCDIQYFIDEGYKIIPFSEIEVERPKTTIDIGYYEDILSEYEKKYKKYVLGNWKKVSKLSEYKAEKAEGEVMKEKVIEIFEKSAKNAALVNKYLADSVTRRNIFDEIFLEKFSLEVLAKCKALEAEEKAKKDKE